MIGPRVAGQTGRAGHLLNLTGFNLVGPIGPQRSILMSTLSTGPYGSPDQHMLQTAAAGLIPLDFASHIHVYISCNRA